MEHSRSTYRNEAGAQFQGISSAEHHNLLNELVAGVGVSIPQICEAASYSMAMIIRVALGFSADEARVGAVVNDSLSGMVVLGTLRHLVNAGSGCDLYLIDPGAQSEAFQDQLKPLLKMGVEPYELQLPDESADLLGRFTTVHALLLGLYTQENSIVGNYAHLTEVLNDTQAPVHTVLAPLGIDANTGKRLSSSPVIASSTMSLGLPLNGLGPGAECVGRHYLCDISLTKALYEKVGVPIGSLFSEQPVIQIFPVKEAG